MAHSMHSMIYNTCDTCAWHRVSVSAPPVYLSVTTDIRPLCPFSQHSNRFDEEKGLGGRWLWRTRCTHTFTQFCGTPALAEFADPKTGRRKVLPNVSSGGPAIRFQALLLLHYFHVSAVAPDLGRLLTCERLCNSDRSDKLGPLRHAQK